MPSLNGAVLYHSLLFACQRALQDSGESISTETLHGFFGEDIIGGSELSRLLEEGETDDLLVALENLGELLVESNLTGSFQVIPTESGFRFVVESCAFAGKVHSTLDPRDVICPYGMLAIYLAGKMSNHNAVGGKSSFADMGSDTAIEIPRDFVPGQDVPSKIAGNVES